MEETPPSSRIPWPIHTKIVISLLLLALGVFLLYRFGVVLQPFILAAILAYVLSPLVVRLQNRFHIQRTVAALIAYLVVIIVLAVLPLVIFPSLTAQVDSLNLDFQRMTEAVESALGRRYTLFGQVVDGGAILEQVTVSLQALIEPMVSQTLNMALEILSSLVWVIFVIVVSFYLIKDGQALKTWTEHLVPPQYLEDFIRLRTEINTIWGAFFRGQLVLALVVASLFTLIGLALGMPFALTMGIMAGLLEFLPSIGHGIWLVIAAPLALLVGSTWMPVPNWVFMLVIVALHLVYQQFDLNYLIPRIIGRSVHLPPLVVILGIVSGAVLAGVLGILLAAPTIASARVLGRYVYWNLFDQEPFPSVVAPPLPPPNRTWWRKTTASQPTDLPQDTSL